MKKLIILIVICFISMGLILATTGAADTKHHKGYGKATDTPPGWSRGEKTGWGGASYPPGWSKWNKEKQGKWIADRDEALTEIDGVLIRYRVEEKKNKEILGAFDETISKGREIDHTRKVLIEALKDKNTRRWLMVDTAQRTLELLK